MTILDVATNCSDGPGRASNKERASRGSSQRVFVGIDTSKLRAIADGGRGGEVRCLRELPATEAAIRNLMAKLAAKYRDLTFRDEQGRQDMVSL